MNFAATTSEDPDTHVTQATLNSTVTAHTDGPSEAADRELKDGSSDNEADVEASQHSDKRRRVESREVEVEPSIPTPISIKPKYYYPLPDCVPNTLNREQQEVVYMALKGHNIFYTGSAGTGKTATMRCIIRALRKRERERHGFAKNVVVTGSTGVAAVHLGGTTIHKFAGVGVTENPERAVQTLRETNKKGRMIHFYTRRAWERARVLIIDEISMVSAAYMDVLDAVARECREKKRHLPFGGLQVILCGDFLQLPPVRKGGGELRYAFDSQAWPQLKMHCMCLRTIFRQKDDLRFCQLLRNVRRGILTEEDEALLRTRRWTARDWGGQAPPPEPGSTDTKDVEGTITDEQDKEGDEELACEEDEDEEEVEEAHKTYIFPYRKQVMERNALALSQLPGEVRRYHWKLGEEGGPLPQDHKVRHSDAEACRPGAVVDLKLGAPVMLLTNLDTTKGLVNGATGVVVDMTVNEVEVEFDITVGGNLRVERHTLTYIPWPAHNIETSHTLYQIPLTVCRALTIHKVQGSTVSRPRISLDNVFEVHAVYTALSRAPSLKHLRVEARRIEPRADPRVLEWYEGNNLHDWKTEADIREEVMERDIQDSLSTSRGTYETGAWDV